MLVEGFVINGNMADLKIEVAKILEHYAKGLRREAVKMRADMLALKRAKKKAA